MERKVASTVELEERSAFQEHGCSSQVRKDKHSTIGALLSQFPDLAWNMRARVATSISAMIT